MNMSVTPGRHLYCSPCSRHFFSQNEFNEHVSDHLQGIKLSSYMRYIEPYVCNQCHISFKEKFDFMMHRKTHLHESMFFCRFCGKDCRNNIRLQLHSCNSNENVTVISNESVNENAMVAHKDSMKVLSYNPSNLFASRNDSVHFTPYTTSAEVIGQSSSQTKAFKPFTQVPFSYSKSFMSASDFQESSACNLRSKNYTCEVCQETFSRKCVLDVHRRKHTVIEKELVVHKRSTKILRSNPCENILTSKKALVPVTPCITSGELKGKDTSHTKSMVKSSDDVLCSAVKKHCRVGEKFQKNDTYNLRKKNAGEMCKELFTGKCKQDVRKRKCAGKQIYNCDVCKKTFKDSFKLRRHCVIHTGEKPYVCLSCDKRFTRKDHLQRHSFAYCKSTHAVHSNNTEKVTLSCNVCKKCFKLKSDLQKHSFTHTDEKPHVCKKCGKGFMQKYRLVTHASSCNGTNKTAPK